MKLNLGWFPFLFLAGIVLLAVMMLALVSCTPVQEREACGIDQVAQSVIVPIEGVVSVLEPLAALPLGLLHAGAQAGCAVVLTEVP
jgi:hypothetical protein